MANFSTFSSPYKAVFRSAETFRLFTNEFTSAQKETDYELMKPVHVITNSGAIEQLKNIYHKLNFLKQF